MFSKVNSFGIHGVDGFHVSVEADVSDGLPSFVMVGYLSGEVKEAQERVRMALKNSGRRLPPRKVTVNLSPADVRKEGTAFDLAIAAAVLCAMEAVCPEKKAQMKEWAFIGELGLDGRVKPVPGILSRVYEAARCQMTRVFLPEENVPEGENIEGVLVTGVSCLEQLAEYLYTPSEEFLHQETKTEKRKEKERRQENIPELFDMDYEELSGLPVVKRACEAAAAGKHNLLLLGPAGTGKTMAARRLPTIMPPMNLAECMEISKIHSICGLLSREKPLISSRPFRSPHHTVTAQALSGGGRIPRPGEISLATHGILFLDELAEFAPWLLDLLRQPMEEGKITVSRMGGNVTFPASPMLVAAMNPCKCGYYPDLTKCRCTEPQIRKYLNRISGPFLDRIDIGAEVPRQNLSEQKENGKKRNRETSEQMKERVLKARERQEERKKTFPELFRTEEEFPFWNSQMNRKQIREFCRLNTEEDEFFQKLIQNKQFSMRGQDKILKVARTLADLDGEPEIKKVQLAEAAAFRSFEQQYWGRR